MQAVHGCKKNTYGGGARGGVGEEVETLVGGCYNEDRQGAAVQTVQCTVCLTGTGLPVHTHTVPDPYRALAVPVGLDSPHQPAHRAGFVT